MHYQNFYERNYNYYNGNIAAQVVNIPKLGDALVYGYKYDQLNRIKSMDAFTGLSNTNNTFTAAASQNFKERITYDANGNIQTYLRNGTTQGGTPLAMDNMIYNYIPNTNQLSHVSDNVPASNYSIDIDNQSTFNYTYDQIGNLTKDVSEGINHISWNVYGKITGISKTDGTKIDYSYDPSGNRISKTVNDKVTWYVRDASGNVMSVYEKNSAVNSGHLTQSEIHMYGSSRLGILTANKDMEDENAGNIFVRGNKIYENTNHLGNVLLTMSDKKTGVDDNSDGIIDYYTADVVSAQDNYCFGMTMPNRSYQSDKYRYGFNGKEKDKDITAGDLDFGARIYDSRLGRWLSTDVLESKYPFASTYCYGLNNPVSFADADGRLIWIPDASYADKITALLEKSFAGKIKVQLVKSDENQRTYLKFELNKDVKLSETETKAFEYLKSLADNQTYTLEVRIYDKDKRIDRYNDYDIDPDNYQSKVLYPNRLADYKPGLGINEAGQYLVHFFAEQYSGVTGQDVYYSAHTFAIGKGGEIFNVKWTSPIGIIKDNKLNVDIDITDKDGNYIQTVRETVDRTTKKSTFTTFIRTDVKPGEKSFGAIMSMDDWAMKTKGRKYDASYSTEYEQYTGNARAAYYKNNPVPDAKKATNNSSTQKTKKNKNG